MHILYSHNKNIFYLYLLLLNFHVKLVNNSIITDMSGNSDVKTKVVNRYKYW